MKSFDEKTIYLKRIILLGFIALIPSMLFLLLQLSWWYASPELVEVLIAPLKPFVGTVFEGIIAVGCALVCPFISIICGTILIRRGVNRLIGYLLFLSGLFLIVGNMVSRPS